MKIPSFWSRVSAFLIDLVILSIIGYIFGIGFESYLSSIGNYALLFGMIITLFYFTIFNSKIFKGQTIGKKLVNVEVVDKNGNFISLAQSLYRSLILIVPYFTVNIKVPGIEYSSFLDLLIKIVLTLLIIGVIVFYIFNKGNRQSLHDILAGTYVISTVRQEEYFPMPKVKKLSVYIFYILTFFLIGFSFYNYRIAITQYKTLMTISKKLQDINGVINASVSKNLSTFYGEKKSTTKSYNVSLTLAKIPNRISDVEDMSIVKKGVDIILKNETNIDSLDIISVTVNSGFNLGIAKKFKSYTIRKNPADWKKLID